MRDGSAGPSGQGRSANTARPAGCFPKPLGKHRGKNLWVFAGGSGGSGGANVSGRWKRAGGQGPIKEMSRGQRGNAGISCGRLRLGDYEEARVQTPDRPLAFPASPALPRVSRSPVRHKPATSSTLSARSPLQPLWRVGLNGDLELCETLVIGVQTLALGGHLPGTAFSQVTGRTEVNCSRCYRPCLTFTNR